LARQNRLASCLISDTDALAHLPKIILGQEGYQKVKHGVVFKPGDMLEFDEFQRDRWVRILDPDRNLLAVGRTLCDSGAVMSSSPAAFFKYERVLVN